ncbi:MAG: hypothetical protein HC875_38725, partial [Anaerolineales bacterium]|nr:hypothetical protein [Anaerolineales bacterium]
MLTGFSELAARMNVQQLPNSLRWGPDQRVHLAEGGNGSRIRRPDQKPDEGLILRGRDLSFNPRTLVLRAESGAVNTEWFSMTSGASSFRATAGTLCRSPTTST